MKLGILLAGWACAILSLGACHDHSSKTITPWPQTAELRISLASGQVTVDQQPDEYELSGSASYDDVAGTVTVALAIRNRSGRVLHNLKLLVDGVSEGSVAGDGTFGAMPAKMPRSYVYYGPEALVDDAQVSRDVAILGVSGEEDIVTLRVELRTDPWIFNSGWNIVGLDASGSGQELVFDGLILGELAFDLPSTMRVRGSSPDGRYLYLTGRNQPAILVADLATLEVSWSDPLIEGALQTDGTGAVGAVSALSFSPDGSLVYAVVLRDAHLGAERNLTSIELVKLDAQDLTELDRLVVLDAVEGPYGSQPSARTQRMPISADGSRGILAITRVSYVQVVDLDSFTLVDSDPGTAGVQGVDVSAVLNVPRFSALSLDGRTAYLVSAQGPASPVIHVVDLETGALDTLSPPTMLPGAAARSVDVGPDGRVYLVHAEDTNPIVGVSIYDPADGSWIEHVDPHNQLTFDQDVYWVQHRDGEHSLRAFAYETDLSVPVPATGAGGIPTEHAFWAHGMTLVGN